nr:selenium cofactor biosynthesis protein YqeC [uncultured Blautia sp.]
MSEEKTHKEFCHLPGLEEKSSLILAVTGGGGKTSLIIRLAQEWAALKKKVLITTTTHMAWDPECPFVNCGPENSKEPDILRKEVERKSAATGYVFVAAHEAGNPKISRPEVRLPELKSLCDILLIEADGSRGLPLKFPEIWEPAMPEEAEAVIAVAGLDAIGRPLKEVMHRPASGAEFLKKSLDERIETDDMIKLAESPLALRKNMGDRPYLIYFNKTDIVSREVWEHILHQCRKKGIPAKAGSLKKGFWYEV